MDKIEYLERIAEVKLFEYQKAFVEKFLQNKMGLYFIKRHFYFQKG